MRTVKYFTMAVLTMGLVTSLSYFKAAEEAKAKLSIEEVMEKAHKGKPSLYKQVSGGKANAEQKKELLSYYEELAKNPAPKSEKGNPADWKKRTDALVTAAKDVVAEKDGAAKKLAAAANCAKCHQVYKTDE
jgi:hypothetical protein